MVKISTQLLLVLFAANASYAVTPFDLNQSGPTTFVCPSTENDWLFSKEHIALALTSDTKVMPKRITDCLKTLETRLNTSPKLQGCFANLIRANKEVLAIPSSAQSLIGKPIDYIKNTASYVEVSPELKADAFLKALGEGNVDVAEAFLENQNLVRRLQGKGKFEYALLNDVPLNAADGTGKRRFFVYDPDIRPCFPYTEKWFSFTVGGGSAQATDLTVVATHWDEKAAPNTYFATHRRTWDDGRIVIESALDLALKQKTVRAPECYECHTNGGPLTVHSTTAPLEKYAERIQRINAHISEIPMGFSKEHSQTRLAMGRDIIDVQRLPDQFIVGCFANIAPPTQDSLDRVRQTLACHQCHDGSHRAKLPVELPPGVFTHRFINGSLPPGNNLSPTERLALSQCVDQYLSQGTKPGMLFYQWFNPQCDR